MILTNTEEQKRKILYRLEQLILQAEENKEKARDEWGNDSKEYKELEAYEDGAFAAFAIVKKVLEGDYDYE